MTDVAINEDIFLRRLKLLYSSWKDGDTWSGATAIAVAVGASKEELRYHKSITLQLWLFAYEIPDTIIVFTKDKVHFLTSTKKASLIQPFAAAARAQCQVELQFHIKPKGEDGSAQVAELIRELQASGDPAVVGHLPKDKPEGKLTDMWAAELAKSELQTVDVASGVAAVLSVKDEDEIKHTKKAGYMAARVMKDFTVAELEVIIDEEKRVKHSKLGSQIEKVCSEPTKIHVKLDSSRLDIAYAPIVQSGGQYDIKPSAQSDDRHLEYDVVLCSIGVRYSSYCANVARTYLVDPTKQQEAQYKALLQAQEAAIGALVEGAPMSAAGQAVVSALEEAGQQDLLAGLPKNVGFGMGLEFRESANMLNAKNDRKVQAGMVFNVVVGVQGLQTEWNKKTLTYALLVADTVVAQGGGAKPEVLTSHAPKGWSDVAYYFKDDNEGEQASAPAPAPKPKLEANGAFKKTNLRSEENTFKAQEQTRKKQKENQEDLLKRVNEETMRQLRHAQDDSGPSGREGRKISDVVSYRSLNDIPSTTRAMVIQVDQRSESVLLPIYGVLVPFHILTIKNATNNQDGDHAYIRLNFNFGPSFEPGTRFPQAIFLKELSFRTSNPRHAAKVVQEIKVLRSNISAREREKAERATLVQQDKLIKAKGRMYTLPDVWIRPNFGGKGRKVTGQLEAHSNGFRYSSPKGETLDIMFRNIKHAFFQPAENEMICLLHFNLKNPIMVGKKKTQDVQFFTEVMDSVQTLDGGRRSMYDPDEIEEEQREREQRNKINKVYQQYVKKVQQDVWERDHGDLNLEFEIPFRELGFNGVPFRSTAFVMPTVNCLVELVEMPFTVVAIPEVAIVNLERVGFNLRNFDMVIIFKDLTKDVFRIDAIPSQSLDTVREWLSSMDVKFYENKVNLNWKQVLKSIVEDPEGFEENGGWSFLDQEAGDSEEEEGDSEEGDAEFRVGSDDDEDEVSSEDEDDSEGGSVVDSEDADEEGSEEEDMEDEEEGLSWDELEKEAAREDRRRPDLEVDDDRSGGKRRKMGSGGGDKKRPRH